MVLAPFLNPTDPRKPGFLRSLTSRGFPFNWYFICHITNSASPRYPGPGCRFPPRRRRRNCVQQICAAELLKSLTGAGMRISIKTDPGWSLLVAKLTALLHHTALDGEVCNYIPLNNWNRCPRAMSSSNRMFNITSLYLPYILHAVSLAAILFFKDALETGWQQSAPTGADLAKYELWLNPHAFSVCLLTDYVFSRFSYLGLADRLGRRCRDGYWQSGGGAAVTLLP